MNAAPSPPGAPSSAANLLQSAQAFVQTLRGWRQAVLASIIRHDQIAATVAEDSGVSARYCFLITMSCGIASLGLLQNSAAVIIGAMLISPLMGPIIALGFSLCVVDYREMRTSLATLAVGVLLAIGVSVLIVTLSPLQEPTSEIMARTHPTLFDLLIAVFSGLAAAYAVIRRKGEAIVGVAIATALMPPLAVTGFGLATGNAPIASGAFLLFMTNLLAIALSVTLVAKMYGFGVRHSPAHTAWQSVAIAATFALLSVPLALSLQEIVTRSRTERAVRVAVQSFLADHGARLSSLRIQQQQAGGPLQVEVVAITRHYDGGWPAALHRRIDKSVEHRVELSLEQLLADSGEVRDTATGLARVEAEVRQLRRAALEAEETGELLQRATAGVRDHFGAIEFDEARRDAVFFAAPEATLALAEARRVEEALLAALPGWTVRVVPATQPLPSIAFPSGGAQLDASAEASLELVRWALSRWNVAGVEVTGRSSSDGSAALNRRLALQRAEAVSSWLAAHDVATVPRASPLPRSDRALERELGAAHFRSVEIVPQRTGR